MSVSYEMASSAIRFFERAIEREKAGARPTTLEQLRLPPDRVRAQIAAAQPLSPEAVRRAMVRQIRKGSVGRGGLPDYVVATMYADYQRLKSLAKVGRLYGRTRQSIYSIFAERGLELNSKTFQEKITFEGRHYTPGKSGYYRDTTMRKRGQHGQLHHAIWTRHRGAIPAGHQVFFKDGDRTNFALENLGCLPIAQVTRFHHRRRRAQGRAGGTLHPSTH